MVLVTLFKIQVCFSWDGICQSKLNWNDLLNYAKINLWLKVQSVAKGVHSFPMQADIVIGSVVDNKEVITTNDGSGIVF